MSIGTNNRTALVKRWLLRFHLLLLAIYILNGIICKMTDFSLSHYIVWIIMPAIYITGILLFFYYARPFKKAALYFSIYIVAPLIVLLSFLMGGMFSVLLASLFLLPFNTDRLVYAKNDFIIYSKFSGFLGGCCNYEIDLDYIVFEKKIAFMREDEIEFDGARLNIVNDSLHISYKANDYDYERNQLIDYDTVVKLKLRD